MASSDFSKVQPKIRVEKMASFYPVLATGEAGPTDLPIFLINVFLKIFFDHQYEYKSIANRAFKYTNISLLLYL